MKRFTEKIKDFADQVQEDNKQNKNTKGQKSYNYSFNSHNTSNPEQVIGTMWSYFFAFWFGIFISLIAIIFLLGSPRTSFLAILIIIAMPFWAIFCFVMMIPDVKIFGVTVFSRRNLSLKKSVSLGRRIVYTFSREFYRQNPVLASILVIYALLIIGAIIYAVGII